MTDPIRVVLGEDHVLLRTSLATIINHEDDMEVVGEAGSGQETVALTLSARPDVVLMDIRMPGINGLDATRTITSHLELTGTKVVILTMFEVDEYVRTALAAGAAGFLLKDAPPPQLLAGIRRVAHGERVYAATVLDTLVESYLETTMHYKPDLGLTRREIEILTEVGRGLSNQEICQALSISMGTVKTHIGRLLMKLQARDRAQLVIAAYEGGLV